MTNEFITKKPIADAPRDGSDILIWEENNPIPIVVKWTKYDEVDAAEIGEEGFWEPSENLISEAGYEPVPISFVDLKAFRDAA